MELPKVTKPLTSQELAEDAKANGVVGDAGDLNGDDPRFLESGQGPERDDERSRRKAAETEADVTLLPPG